MHNKFKSIVSVIFISFYFVLGMFSQTSPRFSFGKTRLTITDEFNLSNNLKVYRGQISEEELDRTHPILGTIQIDELELHFTPLVPFGWNQEYTFIYNNTIEYFTLEIPEAYNYLAVEAIYPSAKSLPSNLLKWYVQFSHPVNEVHVYDYIRFINNQGDTLSRTTLSLENALISEDGKLLTVWIEPGRQKRDLIPNKQLGPVFENDAMYQLIVLKNIKDRQGVSMQKDFTHLFKITYADRIQPSMGSFKILPPENNDDLVIFLGESMDYGSTLNSMKIINAEKQEIYGEWQLTNNESTLIFTPKHPWKKGQYQVLIDSRLEDLAGNNLNRLFDSGVSILDKKQLCDEYKLEFSIK
ncbi:Ig-like domain-containing protein [Aquimarina algiphila]|uniref:SbsA Ig-like domain-containing protein n=1 Tax=Aquimarina algiphila TaxID=2047982 RepID=A0A554VRU6_9FLAO|nr:Ig-like domain-containing protein [Aquimarina algiphila]TSE11414.1 hypothetical protein FOF46_00070 [Aquimarina algiphila]